MKKILYFLFVLFTLPAFAQKGELADPKKPASSDFVQTKGLHFSFIETDYSLSKHKVPTSNQIKKTWNTKAWKNETIQTLLAFWNNDKSLAGKEVRLVASDLKSSKGRIAASHIQFSPIAYVMSNDASHLKVGCGIGEILDSLLVADRIENKSTFTFQAEETRALWLSIAVPAHAAAGTYKGTLHVEVGKKKLKLPYSVEVTNQVLPAAKDWAFHLDLWQNPYSSARYHQMDALSDQHLAFIKPNMQRLANAGQKNITATLIYDPWNSQTYDKYDSMVRWVKKKDGSWSYDYSKFDKWVNYMQGLGVNGFINCYSMIPWNLSFYYFDEQTGKTEVLKANPHQDAYKAHWLPFLKDFAAHLKRRGWFNKTTIAMDERPMKDMQAAIKIIREADPNFQISLAGSYHKELSDDLVDYSITLNENMDEDVLAARKAKGYKTTLYTCCTEIFPNTFTNSNYQESIWLMLNSVERGFDGYLRWAVDCWNANPLYDTRFGPWPAGDTYLIYPNNETSIRFERLREGIQYVEKIRVLREEWTKQGKTDKIKALDQALNAFSNKNINKELISSQVKSMINLLNSL